MTGIFLATAHAAAAPAGLSDAAWFFAVVAAAAGALARWIAPVAILLLYLVLHTGTGHAAIHTTGTRLTWIVVLVVGGFIGWQLGGRAILRHIGEREYRNRIASAKGISWIWGSWFGDRN